MNVHVSEVTGRIRPIRRISQFFKLYDYCGIVLENRPVLCCHK